MLHTASLLILLFVLPVLAQMDGASAIWGGIVTLLITKFFDWLMLRETNRKIAAVESKVDVHAGELKTEAKDAKDLAALAAVRATATAQTVAAVFQKTEAQDVVLGHIEKQTNGALDALRAESATKDAMIADLTAKLEAARLLLPPGAAVPRKG